VLRSPRTPTKLPCSSISMSLLLSVIPSSRANPIAVPFPSYSLAQQAFDGSAQYAGQAAGVAQGTYERLTEKIIDASVPHSPAPVSSSILVAHLFPPLVLDISTVGPNPSSGSTSSSTTSSPLPPPLSSSEFSPSRSSFLIPPQGRTIDL
jgi:hypothetical protein